MNRYLLYRRIRGPVFLLTFGVTALLAQWDVLSFSRSWPLYLIVAGVLRLVENATFASGSFGSAGYPVANSVAGWDKASQPGVAPAPGTSLATVAPAGPLATTPGSGYTPVREEER